MEPTREKDILIQGLTDNAPNQDIVFQFEKALYLMGKPDLIGLLLSLMMLNQIGYIHFKTQRHLARAIGFSEPTFIKKRKDLEMMGILSLIDNGNRRIINLNFLSRLKFFKLPTPPTEQLKYLDTMAKSIKSDKEKVGQMELTHGIYINNNSSGNTNITNNSNTNNDIHTPVDNRRFPKEDYDLVLEGFKKYKGVGIFGPEVGQCLRAIKTMFRSNRKPKEIIDFMQWLHDNENNEETIWVKTWTIWTVQKKISEFVAGKLKVKTTQDEYPRYKR